MAKLRLMKAINEAIIEEMERDERVVLFGEDVEISLFGDTVGLVERFGALRIRNTPICENVMTGMAAGAAAAGYRPICHLMYGNFIYTGYDAIANQVSKLRYMTAGQIQLPLVYFAVYGGGRAAAAQHSDVMYPGLMNLGGIKIAVPSTPADAKGLFKSAIRDDGPVVFLVTGGRTGASGEVPDGEHIVPLGVGDIKKPGSDVTLVAISGMVAPALVAAQDLESEGVSVEVIDPRCVAPLDMPLILQSVRKTGRLVVVDEARDICSAASHIAAVAADAAFPDLKAPIKRVTVPDVAIPYSPPLEKHVLPNKDSVIAAVRETLEYGATQ
jgi:acetoin:2,6-dichlorophenolindophenol oxidoreductase subunit beta